MEGFCRGCLIKYDEPTDLLQYTEKNRRLFVYSTGLQVKRNDAFSFQLCKDCYLKMKLACNFKKMCRNSDKRFSNYQALKEAGDDLDFCTFIKNKDDSITFRFPLLSGNSTPLHRNNKDDDNESTCTSIRNFMTDIFKANDIPDTEARIIREVIEEEADVLDDSLDSHWLQDDASIDTDFRLDFSFSPFSTPRPENKDRCHTPPKLNDAPTAEQHQLNYYTAKKILQNDIQLQPVVTIESSIEPIILDSLINEQEISKAIDTVLEIKTETPKYNKFYIENDEIYKEIRNDDIPKKEETKCTIDRNLEKALQNEDNQEYCLDDLLVTPRVVSGGSGPSTPTINNIIFGENLDIDYGNSNSNEPNGHCIENYVDVKRDVEFFEDFYYKDAEDHVSEDIKNKESKEIVHKTQPTENKESEIMYDISNFKCKLCDTKYISARGLNLHFSIVHKTKISLQKPKIVDDSDIKYDLLNFLCKTCDKKFDSEKALKIHLSRLHKIKLPRTKRTYKETVCDICGKVYHDRSSLMRHKKIQHEEAGKFFRCDLCSLKFATRSGLTMHMTTHTRKRASDPPKKTFVCTICGAVSTTSSNLQLHMLRHAKKYMFFCNECGKGFYTKYNLTTHLRSHLGIRPYQCEVCENRFARRDALNLHMKRHTAETHYECERCGKKFVRHYIYMSHIKKCPTIDLRKETDLSINIVGKNRVISVPAIIKKSWLDSNARKAKQKSDGNTEIAENDKVVSVPTVEANIDTVDGFNVTIEIPSTNGNNCFLEKDKEISLPTLVEETEMLDSTVANKNKNAKNNTSVLEHHAEVSLPIIEVLDMFESNGSKENNLFEAVSNLVGNSKNISLPIIVADAEV